MVLTRTQRGVNAFGSVSAWQQAVGKGKSTSNKRAVKILFNKELQTGKANLSDFGSNKAPDTTVQRTSTGAKFFVGNREVANIQNPKGANIIRKKGQLVYQTRIVRPDGITVRETPVNIKARLQQGETITTIPKQPKKVKKILFFGDTVTGARLSRLFSTDTSKLTFKQREEFGLTGARRILKPDERGVLVPIDEVKLKEQTPKENKSLLQKVTGFINNIDKKLATKLGLLKLQSKIEANLDKQTKKKPIKVINEEISKTKKELSKSTGLSNVLVRERLKQTLKQLNRQKVLVEEGKQPASIRLTKAISKEILTKPATNIAIFLVSAGIGTSVNALKNSKYVLHMARSSPLAFKRGRALGRSIMGGIAVLYGTQVFVDAQKELIAKGTITSTLAKELVFIANLNLGFSLGSNISKLNLAKLKNLKINSRITSNFLKRLGKSGQATFRGLSKAKRKAIIRQLRAKGKLKPVTVKELLDKFKVEIKKAPKPKPKPKSKSKFIKLDKKGRKIVKIGKDFFREINVGGRGTIQIQLQKLKPQELITLKLVKPKLKLQPLKQKLKVAKKQKSKLKQASKNIEQKQKVLQKQKKKILVLPKLKLKFKQKQLQIIKVKQKQLQKKKQIVTVKQKQLQVQVQVQKLKFKQKQRQEPKTALKLRQLQGLEQVLLLELIQLQKQDIKTVPKLRLKQKVKQIEKPKLMGLPFIKLKKKLKLKFGERFAYNLRIKRAGKIRVLNVRLPRNMAIKRLITILDNSIARSGEIFIVGKTKQKDIKAVSTTGFRKKRSKDPKVLRLVETSKKALDTKRERRQLAQARKRKAKKKIKKKKKRKR